MRSTYSNDWMSNYALASLYLHVPRRNPDFHNSHIMTDVLFGCKIYEVEPFQNTFAPNIFERTIRRHFPPTGNSHILSRAAAYCLQTLFDNSPSAQREARKLLQIGKLNRKIRKSYPWRWHKRTRSRLQADQQVLRYQSLYSRSQLTTFGTISNRHNAYSFDIYSVFDFPQIPHDGWRDLPFRYLSVMEYFIDILPLAGRYAPLVDLCSKRSFSPMSMLFPDLSKVARRAIGDYLVRTTRESHAE